MKFIITIIGILLSNFAFSQCNITWPVVSGTNQVISVNSRVVSGGSLTGTLTINTGITLCVEGTGTINVNSLTNNGTINHNGTGLFRTTGNTVNNGIITSSTVTFQKYNSSYSFINNDSINCADIFIQASSFTNNVGATMISATGIQVNCNTDNYGYIEAGTLFKKITGNQYITCHPNSSIISHNNINMNYSTLTTNINSTISATNNIDLSGIINNSGLIEAQNGYLKKNFSSNDPVTNTSSGVIKSFGNMTIEAHITNSGLIEITNGGVFEKTNTSMPIDNNLGGTIIVKGNSSVFQANGQINNSGVIVSEGNASRELSAHNHLTNSINGDFRVCGDFTRKANITNDGVIEIGHDLIQSGSSSAIIQNNSDGKINIVNNLKFYCNLNNYSRIIIGDSLWHTNNSSGFITVADSGIIFCKNYIHDNGALIGGATASQRGYINICNVSKTMNTVAISGYLDITDFGHPGVAPYFDSESPSYPWPMASVTDAGSMPPGLSAHFVDSCSLNTIATADCIGYLALPIELIEFSANLVGNNPKVKLTWVTVSEINNDYFTILRSKDAVHFEEIGTIQGAGNSIEQLSYNFYDENPYSGTSYYQLKQTDFDGKSTYSAIRVINLNQTVSKIVIYPNPTNNQITIQANKQELESIKIYNSLGENVTNRTQQFSKTDHIIIDLSNLSNGIYTVKTLTIANKVYKQ